MRKLSIDGFKTFLGLSEEDLIEDAVSAEQLRDVEIVTYNEGDVLTEEDTSSDNNLFLVLTGCVTVSQRDVEDVPREMHRAYQGGLLGQLQVLTCEPSFFTYTAVQGARCAVLSEINVRRIMGRHPHVALSLAMSVVSNLSPHVRSIDFALEWMLVESGKALYKQDTKADSTYVVLSGEIFMTFLRITSDENNVSSSCARSSAKCHNTLLKTRAGLRVRSRRADRDRGDADEDPAEHDGHRSEGHGGGKAARGTH